MSDLILEGVTKRFSHEVVAVQNLSLSVRHGEFLVLLGPSGCGKTTILRLIAGLETASAGKIHIGGRDVTDEPPRERNIAMVFQNYALYPHMTAYENIAFGLRTRKVSQEEIDQRVKSAAEMLGIGKLLGRRPKALSGGERQRIALGRALVRKPDVFLFDEPLSNLDTRLRVQMRHEILNLHRRVGATAVYVTHDQFEAMTMGDRIAVLEGGRLQQLAPPEELYRRPRNRFVAEFIGTPAINILPGKFLRDSKTFACDAFSFPWPADLPAPDGGREVPLDFGIRPEALMPDSEEGNVELKEIIERIEMLGGEYHIYLRCGGSQLVSRLTGKLPPGVTEGKELKLYFKPEEGHFFEAESGRSLLEKEVTQSSPGARPCA